MKRKKRDDIVIAAPLSHDGVRYEVVLQKEPGVFDRAGSVVAAYAEDGDVLLWSVNVFDYPMPEGIEGDKKTVFIREMRLEESGTALEIDDERGGRYRLDIATHEVETRA